MYYEIALVTEAEFVRLIGCSAKDLKKKPMKLRYHEEGDTLNVYPLSLRGMSDADVFSVRKMRVFHRAQLLSDQYLVTKEDQCAEQQATNWFDFACKNERAKRPQGIRMSQRNTLPTLAQLREDAEKVQSERREVAAAAMPDSDSDGEGDDKQGGSGEESSEDGAPAKNSAAKTVVSAGAVLAAQQGSDAACVKRATAAKKKAREGHAGQGGLGRGPGEQER